MEMKRPCSGKGNSLCVRCNRARLELMAKYNIDSDTAIEQLREMHVADTSAADGSRPSSKGGQS